MSWYVYIDDASSGPYDKEQLAAFLKPTHFVARVGTSAWVEASQDPDLALLFIAPPVPEEIVPMWYVTPKGKPQRGRFTPQALSNMLKKNSIGPDDLLRHESWSKGLPIRETQAWKRVSAGAQPEALMEEDWLVVTPETAAAAIQAPAQVAAAPQSAPSLKQRFTTFSFEWTPLNIGIIVAFMAMPLTGYMIYDNYWRGSDMEFRWKYGTASGECKADEGSRSICEMNASKCGCSEKASCGMASCDRYARFNNMGKYEWLKSGKKPPEVNK